jgi:hypothetical protein
MSATFTSSFFSSPQKKTLKTTQKFSETNCSLLQVKPPEEGSSLFPKLCVLFLWRWKEKDVVNVANISLFFSLCSFLQ